MNLIQRLNRVGFSKIRPINRACFSSFRKKADIIKIQAQKLGMYTERVGVNLTKISDENLERITDNLKNGNDNNSERILKLLQQWDFNQYDESLYVKIDNVSYGDINIFNTIMAKKALRQLELNSLSKRLHLYRSENSSNKSWNQLIQLIGNIHTLFVVFEEIKGNYGVLHDTLVKSIESAELNDEFDITNLLTKMDQIKKISQTSFLMIYNNLDANEKAKLIQQFIKVNSLQ